MVFQDPMSKRERDQLAAFEAKVAAADAAAADAAARARRSELGGILGQDAADLHVLSRGQRNQR